MQKDGMNTDMPPAHAGTPPQAGRVYVTNESGPLITDILNRVEKVTLPLLYQFTDPSGNVVKLYAMSRPGRSLPKALLKAIKKNGRNYHDFLEHLLTTDTNPYTYLMHYFDHWRNNAERGIRAVISALYFILNEYGTQEKWNPAHTHKTLVEMTGNDLFAGHMGFRDIIIRVYNLVDLLQDVMAEEVEFLEKMLLHAPPGIAPEIQMLADALEKEADNMQHAKDAISYGVGRTFARGLLPPR